MCRSAVTGVVSVIVGSFCLLQAQVTLSNGVTVPKDHFIVYLFAGSCNMSGRTDDGDTKADPRCWAWGSGANARDLQSWVPCVDLIFNDAQGAGPATPFLKLMASRYPGYYFGVIQFSNSGAAMREAGLTNGFMGPGYTWYDKLVADAKKLQSKVTLAGLFTMVGIVEAQAGARTEFTASFSSDYKTMADAMRTGLAVTPALLPIIQLEQEHEGKSELVITLPAPAQVWAQCLLIPSKVTNSATISSIGIPIMYDTHHYDHAGESEVAKRLADTIKTKKYDFWYTASVGTNSSIVRSTVGVKGTGVRQISPGSVTVPNITGTPMSVTATRLNGALVRRTSTDGGADQVCIEGLSPGTYLVETKHDNIRSQDRVVVR